ncbi:MAG: DUF882 domain-containing protein [Deltaproteobacteria bacterium]|nr:DUF882 domain-containing protein [Deltaproteobacteria bacterium]
MNGNKPQGILFLMLLFCVTTFFSLIVLSTDNDGSSTDNFENICTEDIDIAMAQLAEPQTGIFYDLPKADKKYKEGFGSIKMNGVEAPVVSLFNVHTKEILPIFEKPTVSEKKISYFLRSRGFGFMTEIDYRLIDTVAKVAKQFKVLRIEVVSGYRSDKFNNLLAKKGRHVALKSRHVKGEAIDIRLDGVNVMDVRKWLLLNFEGGIGTYPNDNFIHIDVGPKRSWYGN